MSNILTAAEAATVLRTDSTDSVMLSLLPSIDAFIKESCGRDWTRDAVIDETAKNAARMLLVNWYENPGMVGNADSLHFGLRSVMVQLEAKAQEYFVFEGREDEGYIELKGVDEGDLVVSVVGLVNVTGDQSDNFEAVISDDHYVLQSSDIDLSGQWFEARIVAPEVMR